MSGTDPVPVASAANSVEAQIWVDMLRDEGIRAAAVESGVHAAFGGAALPATSVVVLVDRTDLVSARNVIAESGGASALRPVSTSAEPPARTLRLLGLAAGAAIALLLLIAVMRVAAA